MVANACAVARGQDPLALTPEEDMRQRVALRAEQLHRIDAWDKLPIWDINRRDDRLYRRMKDTMQADLRLIDNGIALAKAEMGAMAGGVPASAA